MAKICLRGISKQRKQIEYHYEVTADLAHFFSMKSFLIEYPVDVTSVPDCIAAVPFVCNVLPIIWLNNATLEIPELDQAFYDCIPHVKNGYEGMFPESTFAGEIVVGKLIACATPATKKSAAFFSGGLDAVHTLVNHLEEKPDLISIWGSDIRYSNADGWNMVHNGIVEYAEKYQLADVVIRSTFREFDKEGVLDKAFRSQLKDGWWHGVKHGIGLLGHAAPYVYLKGISTVYIASSNCLEDGPVRCASNPAIDNHVRFAGCRVVHDGFENSRQDKVRNVVEYVRRSGNQVKLHVCWESQTGGNCCHCEKCYRTMAGLMAEGEHPKAYGFEDADITLPDMQNYIVNNCRNDMVLHRQWVHIQSAVRKNRAFLPKRNWWKRIAWIAKVNFHRPETLKMPLNYRVRNYLSRFKFYQALHRFKTSLINSNKD